MTQNPTPLRDDHGRSVTYLRLSVTDRCNLRCRYCWPQTNFNLLPHQDILTYEEMLHLVDLARQLDIGKLRLTGGEPFARQDFLLFLERIRRRHPDLDLRLTTNGTLLADKVQALEDMGVRSLNMSLDSLERDRFLAITGRDALAQVLRSMDTVLASRIRLKINVVAMRGVNDGELGAFLDLARRHPLDVRYIEFMPMGGKTVWSEANFWPAQDILAQAQRLADLEPVPPGESFGGPARMYALRDGVGRFGLITPMSNHFCGTCNRLRITADGRLRTCLFSDREYRLRPLLRSPKLGDDRLIEVLRRAIRTKPIGAELLARARAEGRAFGQRMSAIGG